MRDWLKLAGREGVEKVGKGEKLWRVGKTEKVSFKTRKKLIAERESALKEWQEVELVTAVEQCVSGANDLDLQVERSINGEMSGRMNDQQTRW